MQRIALLLLATAATVGCPSPDLETSGLGAARAAAATTGKPAPPAGPARTAAPEDPLFPPTTTLARGAPPPLAEPPLGGSAVFADLDTTVTRASNGRHHYAKDSPWNSDESLVLLLRGEVLDGQTYRRVKTVALPSGHRTWANTDPDVVYGVTANRWVRLNVSTGATTTLATYPEHREVSHGGGEGNTDNADRLAVLVGDGRRPFVVDARTGARRCAVESRGKVSDATMSQDGRFALVNWQGRGIDAYDAATCALARPLTARNSHYDACVSAAGDQVVVQADEGRLTMTRIADGASTTVYADTAMRVHVSCRNVRRPGWAYVSVYNETCDRTLRGMAALGRIFAVKLDGSRTVQVFAWDHQPCPAPYDDNPVAAPSPRGDRVWWKVNWDGASSGVHSFVARRRR
jgi:hypothetical protein